MLRAGMIDVLVDVGAHEGSWAQAARDAGFGGRIESFEPHGAAYERLRGRAAADARWNAHRVALSDHAGAGLLHLSSHPQSSSLLDLGVQERIDPRFAYTGSEEVETARLDDLGVVAPGERAYLKADVQGHELPVLTGAHATITSCCRAVELELSFVPLYAGQALAHELMAAMADLGFRLVSLEVSWRAPDTGDLLTANGLFEPALD
jgi:FkbM family methyltransferase